MFHRALTIAHAGKIGEGDSGEGGEAVADAFLLAA